MIRVAIVGVGHWGPNLIRNFDNRMTSEVAWVIDRDAKRLAQVKTRFPGLAVSDDVASALNDPSVDAIVVATPTTTHHALVKKALEHGKHVMVEKPITSDAKDGLELCDLAEKVGKILMVGHLFLYNEGVRRVKKYLEAGELGRVYHVSMVRTNLGPIRLDVNAAWDLGSHDISIANYWLGGDPLTVSAVGGSWINPGIQDAVFATLRYPNQVLVNLHVSWLNPRKCRDITIVGERKMVTLDDMNLNEPLRIYDKFVTDDRTAAPLIDSFGSFRASVRDGDVFIPKVTLGEPLRIECEHFIECVRDRKPPLTGGRDAVGVVRALEALGRSMANGGREETV